MGKVAAGSGFMRLDHQNTQDNPASLPLHRASTFAKLSKATSSKDISQEHCLRGNGLRKSQRYFRSTGCRQLPIASCSNPATVLSTQQSSVPSTFCVPGRVIDVPEDDKGNSDDRFKKILSFLVRWLLPVLFAASLITEAVTMSNNSLQGRPAHQSQTHATSTMQAHMQPADSPQTVLQKAHPAVVSVHKFSFSQSHEGRLTQFTERLPGTGVVWDDKGHIITSYKSIKDSGVVKVAFSSGEKRLARIVGMDEVSDVAVLKLKGSDFTSVQPIDFNTHKGLGTKVVLNVENPKGRVMSVSSGMFIEESHSCEARWKPYRSSFTANEGVMKGVLVDSEHRLVGLHDPIGSGGVIRTSHLLGIVKRIL